MVVVERVHGPRYYRLGAETGMAIRASMGRLVEYFLECSSSLSLDPRHLPLRSLVQAIWIWIFGETFHPLAPLDI